MAHAKLARIAYFSMEIAVEESIPTYAGGLGVLAGDMLRSAADLGLPMVAVTLLYRHGYFRQRLDSQGSQREEDARWNPEDRLHRMSCAVPVRLEGREVQVGAWVYFVQAENGNRLPVYFLDTDRPENTEKDRTLTEHLYGGDQRYRLCQEALLGIGGVRMLRELGYEGISTYHMNEGHAALLAAELIDQRIRTAARTNIVPEDISAVRHRCVFTTHTPVPAGHDQFPMQLAREVLGDASVSLLEAAGCCQDSTLNMTYVALRFSHYINGVGMQHGEVSRGMYPKYPISAISNGVHALTWTAQSFRDLFDRRLPFWRRDNLYLRYAIGIPLPEIVEAHSACKRALLQEVQRSTGITFLDAVFTIGFARRAAAYKRADLLFSDIARLRRIAKEIGPIQVIYAGKAHPEDEAGKQMIRRVFEASAQLRDAVQTVYLEDYDVRLAQLVTSGTDLWLNTPMRPYEASGTSGMKAALNGVPSLSILDGWWIEGNIEGVTGWSIGGQEPESASSESASLYDKLERSILPMFYGRPGAYAEVMRSAIAINGSFFNTQRMLFQYAADAYSEGPGEISRIEGNAQAEDGEDLTGDLASEVTEQ